MVRVEVPATTANFGPAFDAIGMALQLYNVVELEEIPAGLFIEVEGQGTDTIRRDEHNFVYKAAMQVFLQVGYTPTGLRLKVINNIPVASGLGSSAAAIVGGMLAANSLLGAKLTNQQLLELATKMEGHPDNVAAALFGGIVVAVANQGRVEHVQFGPPPGLKTVVAIPKFPMSTKTARGILPKNVSFKDAVFNIGRTALLVAGLANGQLDQLLAGTEDRLHQPYRSLKIPGMHGVLHAAKQAGAKGVALSGAGPTLIAFTAGGEQEIAEAMHKAWVAHEVQAELLVIEPDLQGARII